MLLRPMTASVLIRGRRLMVRVSQAQITESKPVELPIYLVNGSRIFLSCLTSDRTDDIFEVSPAGCFLLY